MSRTTDTTERGLETLIVDRLTGRSAPSLLPDALQEEREGYAAGGYVEGSPADYNRGHAVDVAKLLAWLRATQPNVFDQLHLAGDSPALGKLLDRLHGEIAKRGVIDVLRHGIKHGPAEVKLFQGKPTPGNSKAEHDSAANLFSVTRQVRYSLGETTLALDLVLFLNGLPVATFELKNSLTKQTVEDAVQQYKRDRDPRELLFRPKRCVVHFAVDDAEVRMCTELQGPQSWFLPFNQGWNDGAGNPPSPHGLKTAYLWEAVLTRDSLTDIIEHYAQVISEKDAKGKQRERQIFPRYHQLDAVRRLLAHASANGVGHKYLIQHSAGSGKSNSIAWLAHQLINLQQDGAPLFDTVIVVTDRKVLDSQIRETIKQFARVGAVVGAADHSSNLRQFIESGKRIVISTVQKFPYILDELGNEHRARRFAIIIDEAHSGQGGKTTAALNQALAEPDQTGADGEDGEDVEDQINRIMAARRLLPNASYFAFTATPKNKTLEIFGTPVPGAIGRHPFHGYTMKQAIQEGFILDVLQNYTPVQSYYRLMRTVADDPEFDAKRATKKLRRYVEGHDHAIRVKAEIMADHFHEQVIGKHKIGGQARAMIVTDGVDRAIQYYRALSAYLKERHSPYRAIVAFSGERRDDGADITEATLNGFLSQDIAEKVRQDPYRFLIVADKFQTGYDEPLLHTMYVDKTLSNIKAVQTLSRLNRSHPKKHDTFVLDFLNDAEQIEASFSPYYRTTILSGETDPNKLHDLKAELDGRQVYAEDDVNTFVQRFLEGVSRELLDPILDARVATYLAELDLDEQIQFKSQAKTFTRTYSFLGTILPYTNASWEKLSIFLNFLIPKLPAPADDDLAQGIVETIDLESYRVEVRQGGAIALADQAGEVGPVPAGPAGGRPEAELDRLSIILNQFNDLFGNIAWNDRDKITRVIAKEIPAKVAADTAYQNAIRNSDKQNARIEHDRALGRVIIDLLSDHTELYKLFADNPDFKKWLSDTIFSTTYQPPAEEGKDRTDHDLVSQRQPVGLRNNTGDSIWAGTTSSGDC